MQRNNAPRTGGFMIAPMITSVATLLLTLLLALLLALPAFALIILTPHEGANFTDPEILVTYLAEGTTCHASSESSSGGGPLLIPGITSCQSFSYTARPGWNAIVLSDGLETKSVNFQYDDGSLPASPNMIGGENMTGNETPADQDNASIPDSSAPDSPEPGSPAQGLISDEPIDDPEPFAGLFGSRSVSHGAITADNFHYDYPPGVKFTAYVRVKNVGRDPAVTFVVTAHHSDIIDVRRLEVQSQTVTVDYPVSEIFGVTDCSSGECVLSFEERVVGTRQKMVRRYETGDRRLSLKPGIDRRVARITDARHRTPLSLKGVSSDDMIAPGDEAIYAVTMRAPSSPVDEFYFQAVSSDMAEGLDPFSNTNWSYVRNITLREQYGVTRTNQLIYLNLTGFTNEQIDNCTKEIRVSNDTYDDIPVRVIGDGGNLTSDIYCTILFGANIAMNTNETFYVYFGNPDATAPAAATDKSRYFNLTWIVSAAYFPNVDLGTAGDTSDLIAPVVTDYDCDGDLDLVYGIDDGVVWFRRNTGTTASPVWAAAARVGTFDVGTTSKPEFGYLFGTDVRDLVVGEASGVLNYYENTGTCAAPVWTARTVVNSTYDFGSNSKPALRDLNDDNLTDIYIGVSNGTIDLAENFNTTAWPAFRMYTSPSPSDVGTNNAPTFSDLNFDGLPDLVVGDNGGNIQIFWHTGTPSTPQWGPLILQRYNMSGALIDSGANCVLSLEDINGDGWRDMTIGDTSGYIRPSTTDAGSYLINAPLNATDGQTDVRPVIRWMNITPGSPYKNDTLNCSINVTDDNAAILQVNFTWSENGIQQPLLNGSASCANGTRCYNPVLVTPGNLSPGENWACAATVYDMVWTASSATNVSILYTFLDTIILVTDSPTYSQGEIVTILGSGYPNSSIVNLTIHYPDEIWSTLVATNTSGGFTQTNQQWYDEQVGECNVTAFDIFNMSYIQNTTFIIQERVASVTTNQPTYVANASVGINGALFSFFATIQLRIYDSLTSQNGTVFPLNIDADDMGAFSYNWNSSSVCSGNYTVEALDQNQTQYQANTTFLINNSQSRSVRYVPESVTGNKVVPLLSRVIASDNTRQSVGATSSNGYLEFTFPAQIPSTSQAVSYVVGVEHQRQPDNLVIAYAMYLVNSSGVFPLVGGQCTGNLVNGDTTNTCNITSYVQPLIDTVTIRVNYTTAAATDALVDFAFLNISYYGDSPGCYPLGDEPALPTISSVFAPQELIVLNAGSTKTVGCNVTVYDANGADDIVGANATFYTLPSTGESPLTNVSKYANASCGVTEAGGFTKTFICMVDLLYYAKNGTWTCNATGISNDGTAKGNASFEVDPLFALNISPALLFFGNVSTGYTSANMTVNITNFGNQPMNVSAYGYGLTSGDNLSFTCPASNLSVDLLRFSKSAAATYAQKANLSSSPQHLNFTVAAQSSPTLVINQSYWQIGIPEYFNNFGQCNGTLIFQAEAA